jgi:hypothetical protein
MVIDSDLDNHCTLHILSNLILTTCLEAVRKYRVKEACRKEIYDEK